MEKSNSDDIELENDDLDDEKDPFVSSHRQRLISAQILDSQCEDASVGEDSNVILQTMSPKASKSSTSVSSAAIDSVIELQQSTLADMDLTIANLKSWHERRLASSSETGGWGTASDNDESPYAYPETDDADEKGSSFFSTELRESSDDKRSGWTNGKDADIEAILGGALERRVQEDEERRKLREMGRASAGAIESLLRSPRGLGGSDMKDTSFDEVGSRAYMSSDLADRLKRNMELLQLEEQVASELRQDQLAAVREGAVLDEDNELQYDISSLQAKLRAFESDIDDILGLK